jgi:hypothetical protein
VENGANVNAKNGRSKIPVNIAFETSSYKNPDYFEDIINYLQEFENNELTESQFFKTYEPGDPCNICQEDLSNGESICVNKNCTHGFHCGCINKWLQRNPTCPVCRAPFEKIKISDMQQSSIQNTGFGKAKRGSKHLTLKQINKLIKSLSK